MSDIEVKVVLQRDKRLGRQMVHDTRSRGFAVKATIDTSTWNDKAVRLYDPLKNPNQCHGECTGCAASMMFNAVGNRVLGKVLNMADAHNIYSNATQRDPWIGAWPPTDTGSSGLAAAQAAEALGLGGVYRHVFGGANEVVQLIQGGRAVSVGTWWRDGLFYPNSKGVVEPTGPLAGGHQYLARGYRERDDMVMIRCWWGLYRDVWIKRDHLNDLIMDEGDAYIQDRKL